MMKRILRLLTFVGFVATASNAFAEVPPILNAGDAVVTGFSGVVEPLPPDPVPSAWVTLDETLINPDGISARIVPLASPGYVWDARAWPADQIRQFKSKDIGQVFGVTLDEEKWPNIYVTATSAYGLHIVGDDVDKNGRPDRLKKGRADAKWMQGMWGTVNANAPAGSVGGPGTIWKIDGKTGDVSFFANVLLKGKANTGAGLGNITYSSEFKQLFVSDLSTGMIHRFGLDGKEVEVFDHGVTGRTSGKLKPVPYDPKTALDITKKDFDSQDPETWGFTDADRRVHALAMHEGRLFYSVTGGSQIWSVGFEKLTGKFANDAQWELDVPKKPKALPVTDMLFTHKGAMVLAQRGEVVSTYDYKNFAALGKSRTYRYWLKDPKLEPTNPGRWIAEPQEYAVGFDDQNRNADGGIALNYGYTAQGFIDARQCEATLWSTGDNLRHSDDPKLSDALAPGGPFYIDGLQGIPSGPVIQDPPTKNNQPPWVSYMVDVDGTNTESTLNIEDQKHYGDTLTTGWMGDVAIYHPCAGGAGGVAQFWGGAGYPWSYPHSWTGGGDQVGNCTPGVDCGPPPPKVCLVQKGEFFCDERTGDWLYILGGEAAPGLNANTLKITSITPGVSILNGPVIPIGGPIVPLDFGGSLNGQLINIGLCVYDQAAAASGKPYDCCKTTITVQAPSGRCVKK